jgi:anti-sigma regulatory factor (Ser/Thr protein kinase)
MAGLRRDMDAAPAENARLATLPGAGALLDPFDLTLAVGPHAPATARRAVNEWLTGRVVDGVLEDARLLLSEIVTNCLEHGHLSADAKIRISARLTHGILRLEVHDPGQDGTVERRTPNPPTSGGYGLRLVETVAARWGVNRIGGTHVWFELPDATG